MATTLLTFVATDFVGDAVPVTAGDIQASLTMVNGRMVCDFPDGAAESAAVTPAVEMPAAYAAGTLTAKLAYFSTATSGEHDMEVYVEAVTAGDTLDQDSATGFDAANQGFATVPATAGYLGLLSITLTNKDSVAVGDSVRFLVRRDSDETVGGTGNNGDDASGTFRLLWMSIEEA